jgi:hypothetical protein
VSSPTPSSPPRRPSFSPNLSGLQLAASAKGDLGSTDGDALR